MDLLNDAIDMFMMKYPKIRDNLMNISFDDGQPRQIKQRAMMIKSDLDFAARNVHNNNRFPFHSDEEMENYTSAAEDFLLKGTTAEVFVNSALLKKLRDINGIQDPQIDDYLVGFENKHNIMNRNSISPSKLRENADRLRDLIDVTDEYLLYPPVPPPRTPISPPRSRRRYLPFSRRRRRRSRRTPSGGGRKTKHNRNKNRGTKAKK